MPRPTTLELCRLHLFSDTCDIPVAYQEKITRIRTGYSFWYEFPTKTESQIRDHLMNCFLVAQRTAYEDIQIIKILLGDIQNPGKEWIRYQVNAMLDEAYKVAKKKKDGKGMAMAAGLKGKLNMLHLKDADPLPFDQIVPQPFEPTDDPTELGLKKDPDIREKKRKMLEKYNADIEIIDVPYEEIANQDNDREKEDLL